MEKKFFLKNALIFLGKYRFMLVYYRFKIYSILFGKNKLILKINKKINKIVVY